MRRLLPYACTSLLVVAALIAAVLSNMNRSSTPLGASRSVGIRQLEVLVLPPTEIPPGWRALPKAPNVGQSLADVPSCKEAGVLQYGSPSTSSDWSRQIGNAVFTVFEVLGSTNLGTAEGVRSGIKKGISLQQRCDAVFNKEQAPPSCSTTSNGTSASFSCSISMKLSVEVVPPGHPAPGLGIQGLVDSFRTRESSGFGHTQTFGWTFLRRGVLVTVRIDVIRTSSTPVSIQPALFLVRRAVERT